MGCIHHTCRAPAGVLPHPKFPIFSVAAVHKEDLGMGWDRLRGVPADVELAIFEPILDDGRVWTHGCMVE